MLGILYKYRDFKLGRGNNGALDFWNGEMLIVDPISGKMWKLPTNSVTMDLTKKLAMGHSTLKILTLSQIPEDMRKELISIN